MGAKPSGGEPIYVGTIKYKPGACDRPLLMPREQLVAAVRAAVLKAQPRLVSGMTGLRAGHQIKKEPCTRAAYGLFHLLAGAGEGTGGSIHSREALINRICFGPGPWSPAGSILAPPT